MNYVTFKNQAAQGDVLVTRIDKLPDGLKEMTPEDGQFIVGHSETGHHHVVVADRPTTKVYHGNEPLLMFLNVKEPVLLRHERSFDTHKALKIEPGTYEIRNQREHTPEGWRRVAD